MPNLQKAKWSFDFEKPTDEKSIAISLKHNHFILLNAIVVHRYGDDEKTTLMGLVKVRMCFIRSNEAPFSYGEASFLPHNAPIVGLLSRLETVEKSASSGVLGRSPPSLCCHFGDPYAILASLREIPIM